MSRTRFMTTLIGLAAGLAICLPAGLGMVGGACGTAHAASIKVPPGWAIVKDQPVRYFMFDENMGRVIRKELVESKTIGTQTERRKDSSFEVRENRAAQQSERTEHASVVVNPADRRATGRYLKTYQISRKDKIKVVVTVTPYFDYQVIDYEKRTNTTLSNTYATTTLYSWVDPVTGEQLTYTARVIGSPVSEIAYGDWGPGQDRKRIGDGRTQSEARQVVQSTFEEKLVSTALAPSAAGEEATGAYQGKHITAMATDAGKGGTQARSGSAAHTFTLSGSAKAQASGNFKSVGEEDLFAAAARGLVLYDEEGVVAWKLTAGSAGLRFSPFDDQGALHDDEAIVVRRGLRPTTGGKNARIRITSFKIGPKGSVALSGDFRNALQGGKGKDSSILATR